MTFDTMDPREVSLFALANSTGETRHGGNSEIRRAVWSGVDVAIKKYRHRPDAGERLSREWRALDFLWRVSPGLAPQPIGVNLEDLTLVQGWLPGSHPQGGHAVNAMEFALSCLHSIANSHVLSWHTPAADAIKDPWQIAQQVRDRLPGLESEMNIAAGVDELRGALDSLRPETEGASKPVPTLSPSDFGPHNLLVSDGTTQLIDLEFFGWDDAHKLIADTLLHPLVDWHALDRDQFLRFAIEFFHLDTRRLAQTLQLCRLKWGAISLSRAKREFDAQEIHRGEAALERARKFTRDALAFGDRWPQ